MAVNLSPVGGVAGQFFDNNGDPLVGGKLFTFAAGTTTPQVTYTSASGNIPNSNPIILNGGGRVPSEIWLTDGLEYKFVLYTSTNQLIGSWDNIVGINSNFVNYTSEQEIQTATAGQTVFTLTTMQYLPGTNSLSVFVDGVNQYGPGAQYAYVETNATIVTFVNGLHVGALVKFTTSTINSAAATSADQVSYTPAGTGAVATNVQAKLRETVSVQDFGAVGDGVTDDTAAIQAAIDASYSNYNKTVYVPNGIYKLTDKITITQGVMIICEGSQGSNESYGTVFKHYSNDSCFRWDGSGAQFTGTGGGLQNCLIVKADGFSGGNAIEVINQSDTNRCGEMVFHNILSYGLSSGRWERGFVFDGTATNTPGARGVRTIYMTKCRAADVTTANETIVLNQVTHFYAHGMAVDTGSGAAAGIVLKGINDGVYLNALGCAGTFLITANDSNNSTVNLTIDGKIGGSFTNNDSLVDGTVSVGELGGVSNASKKLNMLLGKKPSCQVTITSSLTDVTGDGTNYKIPFDVTLYDNWGNWGGDSFGVTVAGKYKVTLCVTLFDVNSAHTRADLSINRTLISVAKVWTAVNNPFAMSAPSGGSRVSTMLLETIVDCARGDSISPFISVSNGTKVVDVFGAATAYSYMAIEYLG
jgi:hypothetical protein